MTAYEIDVQVESRYTGEVDVDRLREVAATVLEREGQPPGTAATLVITGDAEIQELNRTYRHVDRTTDVLAFAAREKDAQDAFVVAEEMAYYLGDVIISYPTAVRQAEEEGHSTVDELRLLVVHGCLHLLGYDDEVEPARQRMWARQQDILRTADGP